MERVYRTIAVAAACVCILLNCSEETTPTAADPADAGSVRGRLVMTPAYYEEYGPPIVYIVGVNSLVFADSSGMFEFQFLRPGTYTLVYDYYRYLYGSPDSSTLVVTVRTGEVTDVGDIALTSGDWFSWSYSYTGFYASYWTDTAAPSYYSYNFSSGYSTDADRPDTLAAQGDTIHFELSADEPDSAAYEVAYSMAVDSHVVHRGTTRKLRAGISLPFPSGVHLYQLYRGSELVAARYLYNTRGVQPLLWAEVRDHSSGYADLDLLLVSSAGDTCSYRHRHPDWGVLGSPLDDPLHSGDQTSFYSSTAESISYPLVADGSYVVLVHNFVDTARTAPPERDTAIASVRITADSGLDTVIADTPLLPGQLVRVGAVVFPGGTFTGDGTVTQVWYP